MLVLDGKTFAGDQLVIALGVTVTGEKRILSLVQTASENKRVLAAFLRELGERGLSLEPPLLVVLDGAEGQRAAVPMAQARERRKLSREARPARVAAQARNRVWARDAWGTRSARSTDCSRSCAS